MHTRLIKAKQGPFLLVRPLSHGDVRTVMAVLERPGRASRRGPAWGRAGFNGPKPCLPRDELRQLATVDGSRYALVAHVEGDPQPVAIARIVRSRPAADRPDPESKPLHSNTP